MPLSPLGKVRKRVLLVQRAFLHPLVRRIFVHPFPKTTGPLPKQAPHPFEKGALARGEELWRIRLTGLERIANKLPLAASLHNISRFVSFEGVFQVRPAEQAELPPPQEVLRENQIAKRFLFEPGIRGKELLENVFRGKRVVRDNIENIDLVEEQIDLSRLNNLANYQGGMGQLALARAIMLLTGDVLGISCFPAKLKKMGGRHSPKTLGWKKIESFHVGRAALKLLMDKEYKGPKGYREFNEDMARQGYAIGMKRAYQIASALDPRGGPKLRKWGKEIPCSPQEEAKALLLLADKNAYQGVEGYRDFYRDMRAAGHDVSLSKAYIIASALDPHGGPKLREWGGNSACSAGLT